jgi:hypothetical protein
MRVVPPSKKTLYSAFVSFGRLTTILIDLLDPIALTCPFRILCCYCSPGDCFSSGKFLEARLMPNPIVLVKGVINLVVPTAPNG